VAHPPSSRWRVRARTDRASGRTPPLGRSRIRIGMKSASSSLNSRLCLSTRTYDAKPSKLVAQRTPAPTSPDRRHSRADRLHGAATPCLRRPRAPTERPWSDVLDPTWKFNRPRMPKHCEGPLARLQSFWEQSTRSRSASTAHACRHGHSGHRQQREVAPCATHRSDLHRRTVAACPLAGP
jgi:hypothetical protein